VAPAPAVTSLPPSAPVAPAPETTPSAQADTPALAPRPVEAITERPSAPRAPRAEAAVRPAQRAAARDAIAEANRLRGARRFSEAAVAYGRAAELVPGSEDAYVATVARAELLLERLGRPAEARSLYQAALAARPRGALLDEALVGMAESARLLGDGAGERGALMRLLRERPASPLRPRAEARLAGLPK
jgi:tetratricopeptide (TPR) repeat protein